jgi:hypothetical protein
VSSDNSIIKYIDEVELRKVADKPTNKMLDLWNQLCMKEIGKSVNVSVFNRRDIPHLSEQEDLINTNYLVYCDGKACLGLFLEDTSNLNFMIVTHELGHWVLKLQGVKGVMNSEVKFGEGSFVEDVENLVNSLCSHPALINLQRSIGHEPQSEIDHRANHDIVLVSKLTETDDALIRAKQALYFADDLINCSENHRKGLQRILSKKLPETVKIVNTILEIIGTRDLSIIANANMLPLEIIKQLNLSGNWTVVDSVSVLRNHILTQTKSI